MRVDLNRLSMCARYVGVLGKQMIMADGIPLNTRVEFYLLKGAAEICGIGRTRADRVKMGDHLNPVSSACLEFSHTFTLAKMTR